MAAGVDRNRMEVYRLAVQLSVRLHQTARTTPDWHADLRDQLRRGANSIALNIAEGAGEFSPGDKVRFYRMARRSAGECGAIMDILFETSALTVPQSDPRAELQRIEAMLTALIKSIEQRKK